MDFWLVVRFWANFVGFLAKVVEFWAIFFGFLAKVVGFWANFDFSTWRIYGRSPRARRNPGTKY